MTAAPEEFDVTDVEGIDRDPMARGAVYDLFAGLLEHPEESLHAALADGSVSATLADLLAGTTLDVEPGDLVVEEAHDDLSGRYNDLFVIGYAEYEDRMDGSLHSSGPPVSLHESTYREEVSWSDVNLDLARAYDYFGLEIEGENRDHHDHAPLLLEFAGYLARREAVVDSSAAAARLDLHDRHLGYLVEGMADRLADHPGAGVYGDAIDRLDAFVAADREDLVARLEGGEPEEPADGRERG